MAELYEPLAGGTFERADSPADGYDIFRRVSASDDADGGDAGGDAGAPPSADDARAHEQTKARLATADRLSLYAGLRLPRTSEGEPGALAVTALAVQLTILALVAVMVRKIYGSSKVRDTHPFMRLRDFAWVSVLLLVHPLTVYVLYRTPFRCESGILPVRGAVALRRTVRSWRNGAYVLYASTALSLALGVIGVLDIERGYGSVVGEYTVVMLITTATFCVVLLRFALFAEVTRARIEALKFGIARGLLPMSGMLTEHRSIAENAARLESIFAPYALVTATCHLMAPASVLVTVAIEGYVSTLDIIGSAIYLAMLFSLLVMAARVTGAFDDLVTWFGRAYSSSYSVCERKGMLAEHDKVMERQLLFVSYTSYLGTCGAGFSIVGVRVTSSIVVRLAYAIGSAAAYVLTVSDALGL